MPRSIYARTGTYLLALYALLAVAALSLDRLLHGLGLVWVGRWLGPIGTALILVSFIYSLRKREILRIGSPRTLLRVHEALAWVGALAVLVHGGVHFHALLPWLAVAAMMIAVASGMVGEFLLSQARSRLGERVDRLEKRGHEEAEVERKLQLDIAAVRAMETWRIVHLPVALNFAVLTVLHIITILVFW